MYKNRYKNKTFSVTDPRLYCLLNELYGNADSNAKVLNSPVIPDSSLDNEAFRERWDESEEDRC